MIELKHLGKIYSSASGSVEALKDVNLTIADGEIFGIIGLSGAGKSTLVRCINLLERPTSGEVWVDGQNLTALSEKALLQVRRQIGMIFQSFNLLEQRSVLRNVCFPLEISGTPKAEAKKRAEELLKVVGLADKAASFPSQLSGGQKQRVAIARMLTKKTPVIVFDDSLSAVDTETDEKIRSALDRDLGGATTIIISHRITTLLDCDNILVLEKGRVSQLGSPKELLAQPGGAGCELCGTLQTLTGALTQCVRRRPGWLYAMFPSGITCPVPARPALVQAAVLEALRPVLACGGQAVLEVKPRSRAVLLCLRGGAPAGVLPLWQALARQSGGAVVFDSGAQFAAAAFLPLCPGCRIQKSPSTQELLEDRFSLPYLFLSGYCAGPW